MDAAHAPVITSAIRVPDTVDGGDGRGFYLEDAGQPEFVSWMLQLLDAPRSAFSLLDKLPKLAGNFITHKDTDISAEVVEILGDCAESAGFLPLLGMGRDVPEGIMHLEGTAGCRSTGRRTAPRRSTSSASATCRRPSPRSSAASSSTTRSGCCRASSPCTRWAARRWAATTARASWIPTAASTTTPACTSPTDRSCPARSAPTRASRSPDSPTASQTRSSRT